jgi:hypothetical protein
MSIHSIKESFEEVPTKANSALDSQIAYYKLFIFRFISKSSYALVTFFIVAFASLLVLSFLSFATAYALGEILGNYALGFAIVGVSYILIAVIVLVFRKKLIERPLLEKLSEIYFKDEPDDEE